MIISLALWPIAHNQSCALAPSVLDQEDFRCTDVIFRQFKLYDICGYVDMKRQASGEGLGQWLEGNGTVNSQHGTGVEGISHPCTEGHHPK